MNQKTAKRDPRTDPRPGDELNYNGREPYRVVRREGRFIVDTPINPDHPDYGEDLYHSPGGVGSVLLGMHMLFG